MTRAKPESVKKRLGFTNYAIKGGFDELLKFSLINGFDLVQIGQDSARFFPENVSLSDRKNISAEFIDNGISLCFHGPSDIPLLNRHEKIRAAGLERYFEMIDMAVDMGAEYFVIHPGRLAFYSVSKNEVIFMERKIPDAHLDKFRDSLTSLHSHARGAIEICLENTYGLPVQFLNVVSSLAEENGLGLVWDSGHTELVPPPARERTVKFFQENLSSIKLGHLHDISGGSDHQELGTGELNVAGYLEIFNALEVDIILEIFPEDKLLRSLEYLRKLQTAEL